MKREKDPPPPVHPSPPPPPSGPFQQQEELGDLNDQGGPRSLLFIGGELERVLENPSSRSHAFLAF